MKKIIFWFFLRKMNTYYNLESQKTMSDYRYCWQKGWNDCIYTIRKEFFD